MKTHVIDHPAWAAAGRIVLLLLFCALACCADAAPRGPDPVLEQELPAPNDPFVEWDRSGGTIFAFAREEHSLLVWQWADGRLAAQAPTTVADNAWMGMWLDGFGRVEIIYQPSREGGRKLIATTAKGKQLREHALPELMSIELGGTSDCGRHAVVAMEDLRPRFDKVSSIVSYSAEKESMQVFSLPVDRWLDTGSGRAVKISDDGAHVAVGGWGNGVVLIDMSSGKRLWQRVPGNLDAGPTYAVCFAPDGKTVYAGDSEGYVVGSDVETGNPVSQWAAGRRGRTAPAPRIASVAVSPDGRWLAAGTSRGEAFVWNRANGEIRCVAAHKSPICFVSFSPESNRLLTVGGGAIRVWRLGE